MAQERRRHRLFVTHRSEYHVRHNECVGVRDRESGLWYRNHAALRLHAPGLPDADQAVGARIEFRGRGGEVLTGPVLKVQRPEKHALDHYVSLAASGSIACSAVASRS